MKAEIRADGRMLITAETEIESYALRKWMQENCTKLYRSTDSWPTMAEVEAIETSRLRLLLHPRDSRPSDGLDYQKRVTEPACVICGHPGGHGGLVCPTATWRAAP